MTLHPPISTDRRWRRAGSVASIVVSSFAAGRAHAAGPPCEKLRVSVANELPAAWDSPVTALRERVLALPESECAAVDLSLRQVGDGVVVAASSPDGRRAERPVKTPNALVPIALGLVASIPPDTAEDTPPTAPHAPAASSHDEHSRTAPVAADAEHPVRVALGAETGARAAFPTSAALFEVDLLAALYAHDWIVSPSVRYVPYGSQIAGTRVGEYAYEEVALGLGFGRHIPIGKSGLDLTLAPVLASTTERSGATMDTDGGFKAQVRLNATVRLAIRVARRWSLLVSTDVDVDPFHVASPVRFDPELPALPTWTLGLRAGILGEVL